MRHSYRPAIPPQPHSYRPQVFDHVGLVAGMCEALGIAEVLARATQPDPERRIVTVGHAIKAMVLHGLGFLNHQLSLVPHFSPTKPLSRLLAPGMQASHRHEDTLGRALDTLDAYGVTALSSLLAATAAKRLGRAPGFAPLASTSFQVDGRYNRDEEPNEHGMHITRGSSREQRPELTQVMLDLLVEHQAGMPVLMQPRSGQSSAAQDVGQRSADHVAQWPITSGSPFLGADRALSSAENLQQLAETHTKWITRVPATLSEAQAVLAHAHPQTMTPLTEGYRSRVVPSRSGGVDPQGRQQSADAVQAFQTLGRTAFACEADARQALARCAHDVQTTFLSDSTISPMPPYGQRGRPGPGAQPAQSVSHSAGALASRLTDRQARVDQHSCVLLATNALDEAQLPAPEVLAGYQGQARAERGVRCLKAPQFLASSLSLKKPERLMALLMVMTICGLVYAALEDRMRTALKEHAATFPDQKGKRIQHPTARWVFHDFVGMHVLCIPGQGLMVLNLTDEHLHLLQLLGKR